MTRVLFRHGVRSYLAAAGLGVLAGLLVAFFSLFPADGLWGLAYFSSATFGFWFFSTGLIVLFSEKPYTAALNAALYVYFMFYVTGIFKRLAVVDKGYNDLSYFRDGLWQELAYGALPALVCAALGFALWYGRKKSPPCVLLRFAPAACIAAEAVLSWIAVAGRGQMLFIALLDTALAALITLILYKNSDFSRPAA